jgi:hypothetical protein
MKFAAQIRSAVWDKDFVLEAEQVFYQEIAPAVNAIEDAVKSSSNMVSLLARKSIDLKRVATGGLLSAVVSNVAALPKIACIALGYAPPIAGVLFDAYKERQRQKQALEQNQLYFYYRVGVEIPKRAKSKIRGLLTRIRSS